MSSLFIINNILSTINFIYFMNDNCQTELNIFSGNADKSDEEFKISFAESNIEPIKYINLPNKKINTRKFSIMKNCAKYRLARVDDNRWILEEKSGKKYKKTNETGDDLIQKFKNIQDNLVKPSLIKSNDDDYVLVSAVTGGNKRKIRKHQGIIQTGGNAGRLRKGYKYSGRKLKNGLSQIIAVGQKKN